MALEYRYERYNFQYDVHPQLNAMAAAGWHVHTAMPAYTELYILWERGDVGRARSINLHLDQAKQTQDRESELAFQAQEQAEGSAGVSEEAVPAGGPGDAEAWQAEAEAEVPQEPEPVADDYSEPATVS